MKKVFLILISSLFLSACYQNTAMIGPAITAGSSGNITNTAFSYVTTTTVKKTTGQTPIEHIKSLLDNPKEIN